MKRREFFALVVGSAVAAAQGASAQQATKVHRIGFLRVGAPPKTFIDGFQKGLRDLGYVEGQNLVIEYGLAPNAVQLPGAAAKLLRLKVDVLVTSGSSSVQ